MAKLTFKRIDDPEEPTCAHVCMLTKYVRLPIFIQIVNILDFHFQCQRIESNILLES